MHATAKSDHALIGIVVIDKDVDPVTSLVAIRADGEAAAKKKAELTGDPKIALDLLRELLTTDAAVVPSVTRPRASCRRCRVVAQVFLHRHDHTGHQTREPDKGFCARLEAAHSKTLILLAFGAAGFSWRTSRTSPGKRSDKSITLTPGHLTDRQGHPSKLDFGQF